MRLATAIRKSLGLRADDYPDKADELSGYDPALEPPPLGDVIRRGEAAHRLLNDPTLAEAIAEMRKDTYEDWFNTKPHEAEMREALYRDAHAIERMVNRLTSYRAFARIRNDQAA